MPDVDDLVLRFILVIWVFLGSIGIFAFSFDHFFIPSIPEL